MTAATAVLGGNLQRLFNVRAQGGEVLAEEGKYRGAVPLHNQYGPEAKYAVEAEALLPTTKYEEEIARGLEIGLPGADSIKIGGFPHSAGENYPISPESTRLSNHPTLKTYANAVSTTWLFLARRSMGARRIGPARGSVLKAFARSRRCTDLTASSSVWICGSPFPCVISATYLPFPATLKKRSIRSVRLSHTYTPAARFPWCSAAIIPLASRPC